MDFWDMFATPLGLAYASTSFLILVMLTAGAMRRWQSAMVPVTFALAALASAGAVAAGVWTVATGSVERMVLPMGLPSLQFHLRLDPLAGFFLAVVGLLTVYVSIYSMGYVREFLSRRRVTRLVVFYCMFVLGMMLVVLADDALFFLIAWETMAASSYFLVIFEDERAENRRAAFLYMVMAHVGAVTIMLAFGVLAGQSAGFEDFRGYTFDAMRQAQFSPGWASAAFLLAFVGFGAKAGVLPLHVWLPEAHPVAPSNVSALMSGVMLKTAIYGIVRVTFDLIHIFPWWWGAVVLAVGLVSTVMGVLYALMQHDLKRLLAYHSVENIGIILIGVGLSMIFTSFNLPRMAALAMLAALFHTINHAMFKGLLFMGAGSVLHATHERDMDEMGGLIHRMPWTAALFLVGCISISALPPFNGFVSEWLTFQAFLLSPMIPNSIIKLLLPMGAALLALAAALAAACFVKAFGVTFLGHWRGHRDIATIHEADWFMRGGMALAALTCLALGVLPTFFVSWAGAITQQIVGANIAASSSSWGWVWLTPIAPERASYSGFYVFAGCILVFSLVYIVLHVKPGRVQRVDIWDCGFKKLTPRMQYTSTAFAMPIRRIFGFLFMIKETWRLKPQTANAAFPRRINYALRVRDRLWFWLYAPVIESSKWISRKVGLLQQGRIQTYLIYSFLTIIVLFWIKSL